jgi:peptidoglycan L-alanyl-D-glutamate endopeptidase CwlK
LPRFSQRSLDNLKGVDNRLVQVMQKAIECVDFTVLGGLRSVEQQRQNVANGLSKTMNSRHLPDEQGVGHAVDAAPYPERWDDTRSAKLTQYEADMVHFAGMVRGIAFMMGIPLRYGGDWNSDEKDVGTGFRDLDHFEIPEGS